MGYRPLFPMPLYLRYSLSVVHTALPPRFLLLDEEEIRRRGLRRSCY
jgi:hypothetical protein